MFYTKQQNCKISETKLTELEQKDKSTIKVGDFNICLSTTNRKTKQKFSKDIEQNNTINWVDLVYIYKEFAQ